VGSGSSGLLGGLAPGSRIAGYLLEEQVGAGGMAVVFRAVDERLDRQVALKVLAPGLASDESFRRRFIRESRVAAAVDDPHIVPVYEAGEADGVLFIAMRYVAGGDVHALLHREGPLPPDRVAAIVSPVASALDAAHAAGLIHRDVKPTNMLLDVRPERPDHVYLSDFGLSRGAMASLTGVGQFLGTPDYVAPEQIEGKPVDGQADQYALACAAFEMLTGQAPFRRDEPNVVIWSHLSMPPPSLTALRPGLPAEVDQVFAQALAKAPADRYPRCADFAEALRQAFGLAAYAYRVISSAEQPATDQPAAIRAERTQTVAAWSPAQAAQTTSELGPTGPVRPAAGGPGGGSGSTPGPAARRRWLAAGASAAAVVVAYLVFAAVAPAFPFAKSGHYPPNVYNPGPQASPTTPTTVHSVFSSLSPLVQLLPGDIPLSSCAGDDPSNYNFAILGPVEVLDCRSGKWSVTAFQMQSSADYTTTWQNFINWLGLNPHFAGANCPPGSDSQGIVPWNNKYFPPREGQTLLCWTYNSGGSPFPSYAWQFPSEDAFIWASGQAGTSFSQLDAWWKSNEMQAASPNPQPS
jgi:serine/threonine protein kinase